MSKFVVIDDGEVYAVDTEQAVIGAVREAEGLVTVIIRGEP